MTENNEPQTRSTTTSEVPGQSQIFESKLADKCNAELGRHRNGSTDKGSAMVEVARLVGKSEVCIGHKRANTMNAYFKILEADERSRNAIEPRTIHQPNDIKRLDSDEETSDGSEFRGVYGEVGKGKKERFWTVKKVKTNKRWR